MRKRLKLKRHSCKICKPHKMRGANRWDARDAEALGRWEKERREYAR